MQKIGKVGLKKNKKRQKIGDVNGKDLEVMPR